ncbi:hypothetical protein KASIA_p107 [Shewanella phage vB_SspS_KASIA]|nr:hypothetical protein KASIA_p107 [Shewanella phage vB_SspS_KASIA]
MNNIIESNKTGVLNMLRSSIIGTLDILNRSIQTDEQFLKKCADKTTNKVKWVSHCISSDKLEYAELNCELSKVLHCRKNFSDGLYREIIALKPVVASSLFRTKGVVQKNIAKYENMQCVPELLEGQRDLEITFYKTGLGIISSIFDNLLHIESTNRQ